MVDALQDCAILVEKCRHLDPPDLLLSQLKKELCDYIKEYVSCTFFYVYVCLLILKGFIRGKNKSGNVHSTFHDLCG